MAMLIGMSEGIKGTAFEVKDGKTTIGRNANNILVFDNDTISGRHCAIEKNGKVFTLIDMGSTNGTRLNSQNITEMKLRIKDLIQIGSMEFMFDAEDDEVATSFGPSNTQVEVANGPAHIPETFSSISPFGSHRNTRNYWYILIGIMALVAIVVIVWFTINLLGS